MLLKWLILPAVGAAVGAAVAVVAAVDVDVPDSVGAVQVRGLQTGLAPPYEATLNAGLIVRLMRDVDEVCILQILAPHILSRCEG